MVRSSVASAAPACVAPGSGHPRWSPDGRALVVSGAQISIVYPDGSCLDCVLDDGIGVPNYSPSPSPGFAPSGTLIASFAPSGTRISFIQGGRVTLDGIDGIRKPGPRIGGATDAVWAADGELAVVRGGAIWAGRPGRLRKVAPGSQPAWSPRGDLIAAVRRGWVVIMRPRDGHVRRLARGGAPAFSPDGRWIAFVGPHHRLMIIANRVGHPVPRPVGNIRATSVDWQPRVRRPNSACAAPPGSKVLASTPAAVVTGDDMPDSEAVFGSAAYMGCLRADGRERLLERFTGNNIDGAYSVNRAVLAPPSAALIKDYIDVHYGGETSAVQVFDLRTGLENPKLGGETVGCDGRAPCPVFDQVVLGSDGVSAAHTWEVDPVGFQSVPFVGVACAPATTLCVAQDTSGPGRLFTSTDPASGAQSWTSGALPPPAIASPGELACPSRSLCVAASNGIFTSSNPSAGASTWTLAAPLSQAAGADSVACPSTSLCVVSLNTGSVATSTSPAGGASAWSTAKIDSAAALNAVFCSMAPQCFISDSSSHVFASTNPAGGAGAWSQSATTPAFSSGSCPTPNLCVSVRHQQVAITTDPSAGTWKTQSVADDLSSVSCPSASLCLAVGYAGALYISTDPASGTWSKATIDNRRPLNWIDCPSASLCLVADQNGHVVSSTDPTGGPSAWTPVLLDGDPCNDTTPCSVEKIQASDGTGLHTVDSGKFQGSGPALTGLALAGDTLSWTHGAAPRQITLTP